MASENSANRPPMRIRSSKSNFQFEIDYSKSKDLPAEECIISPTFTVGGYDWALEYFPQGVESENKGSHVSLFLVLRSAVKDIDAEFSFELLGKRGIWVTIYRRVVNFIGYGDCWGSEKFVARDKIMDLYCINDILVISCNISVSVLAKPKVVKHHPGGLCQHIEKLWEKGERFDVTFEVEGESIAAHRFMLAARSPVFEAKLYGSMAEAKMERIKIDEMKAEVFKALLHFIYTDQLPVNESSDVEKYDETLSVELLQDLFVAADRYSLDKLTQLCEKQLKKNLSVDMVATTLVLADRHSRTSFKKKCLEFASAPENFSLVALTEGYLQVVQGPPALFAELSAKVKASAPSKNMFGKKRKSCY